ncbi:putative galactinol--sucrose galactosyltransferase 2 [Dorcoceras hygrometricum]|uniref:Putative galactinol--sucrose galactosyltransferase 2 n=1 Tax=Dorcoceras hygrometricum TaxID=472368 RepID=A0A2Z7B782_9LAMI|nr:putative galactinol--sucrose galactosyltransferase 2 [Dorcoceras hygrometricum]
MAMVACSIRINLPYKVRIISLFCPPNGGGIHLPVYRTGSSRYSMFLKAKPAFKDGVLSFNGNNVVSDVPENVVVTPWSESSAFMGATSLESSSRHVFKLGIIKEARLLSLFRFKIWWMIPRAGNSARDVPVETQMLLLEASAENTDYVLFLPVLDGEFRSSLQGNSSNELEACVESGDAAVTSTACPRAVFVNSGRNPFELIKESMKILQECSGTFTLRENKKASLPMPGILDCFGWCTWDAFYHDVNPHGIREGLQRFGARLMSVKENSKFCKADNEESSNKPHSLKEFISDIKCTFGLKYVYLWHALVGYWGGLHPGAPGTKKHNPMLKFPIQSKGNLAHNRDVAMDCMEKYGIGTIDPDNIFEFYDDLHGYLASQEVDGVKVDVQNILETLATGSGGRVSLTRCFQESLEKSVLKNFQENGIICCMAHNTDSVYSSKTSAITRASDDYYPRNPRAQTLHIAAVAYNSLFFGEIFVPDWDMFYTRHYAAEFHAVARAVGGCGIYVSDKPGCHDFEILKRLVLPDGSILRAKYIGRPTRDCLFEDPVTDGKSLMKIWNLNKLTGVVAAFNCQGSGTWPGMENTTTLTNTVELSGKISPADVDNIDEISPEQWDMDFAIFSFRSVSLTQLSKDKSLHVTLRTLECDVFTISPIKVYDNKIKFAPIGLVNMYNSGGAIESIEAFDDFSRHGIRIKGRGVGVFGAYAGAEPSFCFVNMKEADFEYSNENHFLKVTVPFEANAWEIDVQF